MPLLGEHTTARPPAAVRLLVKITGQALVFLLRCYKYGLSPFLPPACRFTPTCSEYAIEAVEKHGPLKGACMAVCRLLRCHPFSRGGYDPVK